MYHPRLAASLRRSAVRAITLTLSGTALLAGALTPLAADDLFHVDAATTYPSAALSGSESSNNFITLLRDIGDTRSGLAGFTNTAFSGRISYAGVSDAIRFQFQAASHDAEGRPLLRSATFTFRDGHAPVTFTGATNSDVANQVVRYFRREGTSVLSDIDTPVGISDGNPNAASAVAASTTFNAFATTGINRMGASAFDVAFVDPVDVEISQFESGGYSGYRISAPLSVSYHIPRVFDDRLSVQLSGVFTYISIDETDIYQGGLFLGTPFQIIKRQPLTAAARDGKDGKDGKATPMAPATGYTPLAWTVTPNGGAIASGSEQFAQGGIIYLGGLTSALSYDFTARLTGTLGNSFTIAQGGTLDAGDYRLEDDTDQVILKNGISLSYRLTDQLALEGQAVATDFVNRAAIPAYASAALQAVFTQPFGMSGRAAFVGRLGFITDQAPDFHSYGGRVSLGLSF